MQWREIIVHTTTDGADLLSELMMELGAQSVTLGPRILRTETAGLCALAALWTAMGEM